MSARIRKKRCFGFDLSGLHFELSLILILAYRFATLLYPATARLFRHDCWRTLVERFLQWYLTACVCCAYMCVHARALCICPYYAFSIPPHLPFHLLALGLVMRKHACKIALCSVSHLSLDHPFSLVYPPHRVHSWYAWTLAHVVPSVYTHIQLYCIFMCNRVINRRAQNKNSTAE